MGGYGIGGQVTNLQVDVNNMVTILPRKLDEVAGDFKVNAKKIITMPNL
jgi:hypothetical protein